jgi:GNAT superfamily N-acetyltransferase
MTGWHLIRQAGPTDHGAVVAILRARTRWLAERGSDQWSTRQDVLEQRMADRIQRGETWVVATMAGRVVGTISATTKADVDFWTAAERAVPALYLSRLATVTDGTARGLGSAMLDWAIAEAGRRQLEEVRLDAWRTATGLHRYYIDRGWTHLRTMTMPGRYSGALFSRKADASHPTPGLYWSYDGGGMWSAEGHQAV